MTDPRRLDELTAGLAATEARIAAACADAGRERDAVTLVAVTKFFPASDVRALAGLGVRHVGESRHQEGSAKRAALADLDLVWHFIGALQSNKAAAVAEWADVVESVDRTSLISGLTKAARGLDVLIQVNLDEQPQEGRAGVTAADALGLAAAVARADGLRLAGVMAIAPLGADPAPAFARLAVVAADVRSTFPGAGVISAGMSGDLEAAIAAGATHVRVGSSILGNRPPRR